VRLGVADDRISQTISTIQNRGRSRSSVDNLEIVVGLTAQLVAGQDSSKRKEIHLGLIL
jgi:hypothetical protein